MQVRLLKNVTGPTLNYLAGSVQSVTTQAGNDLLNGNLAVPEGPAPSGAIASAYITAGFTPLTPTPSGGFHTQSGWVADAPSNGGFYFTDNYTLVTVFPGKKATTFDLVKMRPKIN